MKPATSRRAEAPAGPGAGRDWRALAACCRAGVDPELFHPDAEQGPALVAQVAAAKAVCAVCPVRAQCLAFAVRALPYGIAGGLTAQERRGLPRTGAVITAAEFVAVSVRGSRSEIAAVGRAELAAGRDIEQVAQLCGVSERTAQRWAAQGRTQVLDASA